MSSVSTGPGSRHKRWRTPNSGRFFFELRPADGRLVTGVALEPRSNDAAGTVEARLCRPVTM